MALPEHVKKQAMDAVSHPETAKMLSHYNKSASPDKASPGAEPFTATPRSGESREIPDHVKQQAMDAVGHKETTAQIRLVKDSGSVHPAGAGRETNSTAEKIASMQKNGHNADMGHGTVTKDNFDKDKE